MVTNNFLFCKLVSKLVTIVINNVWSLELVVTETFLVKLNRTISNILNNIRILKESRTNLMWAKG